MNMAFFALRCICSLYLKFFFNIFENVKKNQNKTLCVHLHVLRAHEVILTKKITLYLTYVKITKFGIKICLFMIFFCVFCTAHKNACFPRNCDEHIEYGDVHANIFFQIFSHFKIYFPTKGIICTWDQSCISATS
jgi:hypothetical protein